MGFHNQSWWCLECYPVARAPGDSILFANKCKAISSIRRWLNMVDEWVTMDEVFKGLAAITDERLPIEASDSDGCVVPDEIGLGYQDVVVSRIRQSVKD